MSRPRRSSARGPPTGRSAASATTSSPSGWPVGLWMSTGACAASRGHSRTPAARASGRPRSRTSRERGPAGSAAHPPTTCGPALRAAAPARRAARGVRATAGAERRPATTRSPTAAALEAGPRIPRASRRTRRRTFSRRSPSLVVGRRPLAPTAPSRTPRTRLGRVARRPTTCGPASFAAGPRAPTRVPSGQCRRGPPWASRAWSPARAGATADSERLCARAAGGEDLTCVECVGGDAQPQTSSASASHLNSSFNMPP